MFSDRENLSKYYMLVHFNIYKIYLPDFVPLNEIKNGKKPFLYRSDLIVRKHNAKTQQIFWKAHYTRQGMWKHRVLRVNFWGVRTYIQKNHRTNVEIVLKFHDFIKNNVIFFCTFFFVVRMMFVYDSHEKCVNKLVILFVHVFIET